MKVLREMRKIQPKGFTFVFSGEFLSRVVESLITKSVPRGIYNVAIAKSMCKLLEGLKR